MVPNRCIAIAYAIQSRAMFAGFGLVRRGHDAFGAHKLKVAGSKFRSHHEPNPGNAWVFLYSAARRPDSSRTSQIHQPCATEPRPEMTTSGPALPFSRR